MQVGLRCVLLISMWMAEKDIQGQISSLLFSELYCRRWKGRSHYLMSWFFDLIIFLRKKNPLIHEKVL